MSTKKPKQSVSGVVCFAQIKSPKSLQTKAAINSLFKAFECAKEQTLANVSGRYSEEKNIAALFSKCRVKQTGDAVVIFWPDPPQAITDQKQWRQKFGVHILIFDLIGFWQKNFYDIVGDKSSKSLGNLRMVIGLSYGMLQYAIGSRGLNVNDELVEQAKALLALYPDQNIAAHLHIGEEHLWERFSSDERPYEPKPHDYIYHTNIKKCVGNDVAVWLSDWRIIPWRLPKIDVNDALRDGKLFQELYNMDYAVLKRPFTQDDLVSIFNFRSRVEAECTHYVASHYGELSEDNEKRLQTNMESHEGLFKGQIDLHDQTEKNEEKVAEDFHLILAEFSDPAGIKERIQFVRHLYAATWRVYGFRPVSISIGRVYEHHSCILEMIQKKDADNAAREMKEHNRYHLIEGVRFILGDKLYRFRPGDSEIR